MIYIFYKKTKKIYLIRPLLIINRLESLQLAIFWKLPIYIDATNKITKFKRNRLRHQIYPIMKTFFNPKLDIAIIRFIKTANFEKKYFNRQFYGFKKLFQLYKLRMLSLKKTQIINKQFFNYFPDGIQKLIYKNLFLFYFPDGLASEFNCLLKLKIVETSVNNLK